jgi:hypothetical protein
MIEQDLHGLSARLMPILKKVGKEYLTMSEKLSRDVSFDLSWVLT